MEIPSDLYKQLLFMILKLQTYNKTTDVSSFYQLLQPWGQVSEIKSFLIEAYTYITYHAKIIQGAVATEKVVVGTVCIVVEEVEEMEGDFYSE